MRGGPQPALLIHRRWLGQELERTAAAGFGSIWNVVLARASENPAPFLRATEQLRADTESLLRRSGVTAELTATLSGR